MDRTKKYEILKKELLEHEILLKSETHGIEKIDFKGIIDIQDIIDLLLEDARKGVSLLKYIELKDIIFEGQNVEGIDFTDTNADIIPQKVKNASLKNTTLNGLDFQGKSFKGINVEGANFEGATNVDLDPQKIQNRSLNGTILSGIDFKNKSFDNVIVTMANFTGATNVDLDPQTVEYSSLYGAVLCGINFEGKSFKNICIHKVDFRGALNVVINLNEVWARTDMERPRKKEEDQDLPINPNLPIFDESVKIIDEEQQSKNFQNQLAIHILKKVPRCI